MLDLLLRRLRDRNVLNDDIEHGVRGLWEWGVLRIRDRAVRTSVAQYYLERVPHQFFSAPSSSTGKPNRHPWWHNKAKRRGDHGSYGGIVRHLTECCILADRLIMVFGYHDQPERLYWWTRDIVLAATLISDTQKNGIPWGKHTVRNHGELAAEQWRVVATTTLVTADFKQKIYEAAYWHYGRFTPAPRKKELLELPDTTKIVHLLDAVSSAGDMALPYNPRKRIPPPPLDKQKTTSRK